MGQNLSLQDNEASIPAELKHFTIHNKKHNLMYFIYLQNEELMVFDYKDNKMISKI